MGTARHTIRGSVDDKGINAAYKDHFSGQLDDQKFEQRRLRVEVVNQHGNYENNPFVGIKSYYGSYTEAVLGEEGRDARRG